VIPENACRSFIKKIKNKMNNLWKINKQKKGKKKKQRMNKTFLSLALILCLAFVLAKNLKRPEHEDEF